MYVGTSTVNYNNINKEVQLWLRNVGKCISIPLWRVSSEKCEENFLTKHPIFFSSCSSFETSYSSVWSNTFCVLSHVWNGDYGDICYKKNGYIHMVMCTRNQIINNVMQDAYGKCLGHLEWILLLQLLLKLLQ